MIKQSTHFKIFTCIWILEFYQGYEIPNMTEVWHIAMDVENIKDMK